MLYAMLWYDIRNENLWDCMLLYAIPMLWYENWMVCYALVFVVKDILDLQCNCNVDKSTFIGLKLLNCIIFGQKYFSTSWKGKTYKRLSEIRPHDLQIPSKRSNPLRYTLLEKKIKRKKSNFNIHLIYDLLVFMYLF